MWLGRTAQASLFVSVCLVGCGGGGSSASSGTGKVDGGVDLSACFSCAASPCASASSSCDSTAGCRDLLNCVLECASTDAACNTKCAMTAAASSAAVSAAGSYVACAVEQCASTCVPSVAVGDAGSSGSSASSSSTLHCDGTPEQSCAGCDIDEGCDCTTLPGCTAGTPGSCSGQITSCSPIYNMEACINAGCEYDDTSIPACGGTMAHPCSMLDGTTCQNLQSVGAGCTWTPGTLCTGTASCAGLPLSTCDETLGCSLQ